MANATARTTIFDNGDFRLHAQLAPVPSPQGGLAFSITSQRQESRNPHEEHVRFFACLDRQGLEGLSDLIKNELAKLDSNSVVHA
jgi:hypothetical protein